MVAAALWAGSEGLHHAGAALHGVAWRTAAGAAHFAWVTVAGTISEHLQRRNIAGAHWRAGGHDAIVGQSSNGIAIVGDVLCLLHFAASSMAGLMCGVNKTRARLRLGHRPSA